MKKQIKYLTQASIIAALYAALTLALQPISFGMTQLRVSEALTILPYFTPAAIPGLFIGCIISNSLGSTIGLFDIIFGSLASLLAAVATRYMPKYLAPAPAVVFNGFILGGLFYFVQKLPFWPSVGMLMLEETLACYGLGLPLLLLLNKYKDKIFDIE